MRSIITCRAFYPQTRHPRHDAALGTVNYDHACDVLFVPKGTDDKAKPYLRRLSDGEQSHDSDYRTNTRISAYSTRLCPDLPRLILVFAVCIPTAKSMCLHAAIAKTSAQQDR